MIRTLHTLLMVLLTLSSPISSNAQIDSTEIRSEKRGSVVLELGGACGIYSLNYEQIVPINDLVQFNFGPGVSIYAIDLWSTRLVTAIPFSTSIALGRNKNKLETGLGIAPAWLDMEDFLYTTNVNLGYRFEGDNGFLFKAGIAGILLIDPDPNATYVDRYIWPKLGFGYQFKY